MDTRIDAARIETELYALKSLLTEIGRKLNTQPIAAYG